METSVPQTLSDWLQFFFSEYGMRNRLRLGGPIERVGLLSLSVKDLQDAIRKKEQLEYKKLGIALSRVVARISCIAEHYLDLPLVESFIAKYMGGVCSYCRQRPCVCSESRRSEPTKVKLTSQPDQTLAECCTELEANYGAANSAKGIENLVNRLFSEVGEILSLVMGSLRSDSSSDQLRRELAEELADALAWTIAVSNFLGVDLQTALADWFWPHCRVCQAKPCQCGPFSVRLVNWEDSQEAES
jgi:NTP pyrophosphatase (non-canonical NTP hydrolase)